MQVMRVRFLGLKIPWCSKWQPTPVFLSLKSQGQRRLVGYSPWGHRVQHDLATKQQGHQILGRRYGRPIPLSELTGPDTKITQQECGVGVSLPCQGCLSNHCA